MHWQWLVAYSAPTLPSWTKRKGRAGREGKERREEKTGGGSGERRAWERAKESK